MDRKRPNEERGRLQEGHDQSASSSISSDDEQLETNDNHNLVPTEDTPNRSINETADDSNVMPVQTDLPAPPAATNPTEEGHVEAPNSMPHANNIDGEMVDKLPTEESVGDEHDERNLIVPMPL